MGRPKNCLEDVDAGLLVQWTRHHFTLALIAFFFYLKLLL
jgi:hypothetical protein